VIEGAAQTILLPREQPFWRFSRRFFKARC